MKFKDLIKDLPLDKQYELLAWRKKHNKYTAIIITFFILLPIEFGAFMAGHYFGSWLH